MDFPEGFLEPVKVVLSNDEFDDLLTKQRALYTDEENRRDVITPGMGTLLKNIFSL